jgi:transcriptional regulator with XRE-family HTH domain
MEQRMKTLREWRLDRVMSIAQLSKASSVTEKTIVDLEHGRRQAHYATIRALCEALNVTASDVNEFAAVLDERSKDAA